MKIKAVEYEACFNLGSYENEKIRLIATLDDDESFDDAVGLLRQRTLEMASPNATKVNEQIWKASSRLADLKAKIAAKTEQWNNMAEFLRTQGINAEAVDMPVFENLLEPSPEQVEQVEEAELVDYDEIPL
ncbi:hypothetical protein Lepto7375DRAFT_3801 [Leptolyngbya sp. PCC 7375]|nr:hypothetical protein Lepto7375DRAFT_3801 [Leptolyngbya sp. PCC 7375]